MHLRSGSTGSFRGRARWHTGSVSSPEEPNPLRRRDPAWVWYLVAVALLLAMAVAERVGLLDPLIP